MKKSVLALLLLLAASVSYSSMCNMLDELPPYATRELNLSKSAKVDFILVDKNRLTLHLLSKKRLVKTYGIALGLYAPQGTKECVGDRKTPEGRYKIDLKNPESKYHRSLRIDYPRRRDRLRAADLGCHPGGQIYIHGLPNDPEMRRLAKIMNYWTKGCVATGTNKEIREIYKMVRVGTDIEICK